MQASIEEAVLSCRRRTRRAGSHAGVNRGGRAGKQASSKEAV